MIGIISEYSTLWAECWIVIVGNGVISDKEFIIQSCARKEDVFKSWTKVRLVSIVNRHMSTRHYEARTNE